LGGLATAPRADATILGTATPNGDGTFTYAYSADNSSGAFDVAIWSLEFGIPVPDWNPLDTAAGGDVSVPNPNWVAGAGIPLLGQSAQDFISIGDDVLTGGVLGGFSFKSSYAPGHATYFEYSAGGDSTSGNTIGPALASVPEGGVGAFGLAAIGLLLALAGSPTRRTVISGLIGRVE